MSACVLQTRQDTQSRLDQPTYEQAWYPRSQTARTMDTLALAPPKSRWMVVRMVRNLPTVVVSHLDSHLPPSLSRFAMPLPLGSNSPAAHRRIRINVTGCNMSMSWYRLLLASPCTLQNRHHYLSFFIPRSPVNSNVQSSRIVRNTPILVLCQGLVRLRARQRRWDERPSPSVGNGRRLQHRKYRLSWLPKFQEGRVIVNTTGHE
jgi:hypothetical protein